MKITTLMVSFNVEDPQATAGFFIDDLEFGEVLRGDEFAVVIDEGTGQNLAFIQVTGTELMPQPKAPEPVEGAILYLSLGEPAEVDAEHARLVERGAQVVTPLQDNAGSRLFQVVAPGGVVVEISAFLPEG